MCRHRGSETHPLSKVVNAGVALFRGHVKVQHHVWHREQQQHLVSQTQIVVEPLLRSDVISRGAR